MVMMLINKRQLRERRVKVNATGLEVIPVRIKVSGSVLGINVSRSALQESRSVLPNSRSFLLESRSKGKPYWNQGQRVSPIGIKVSGSAVKDSRSFLLEAR